MTRATMLPFIGLAAWMGCGYLLGAPSRTRSGSFAAAKDIASLDVWGLMFLAGAAAMTVAALTLEPRAMAFTLFVGGAIYGWWALLFAKAATSPQASANGPAVYAFIAAIFFLAARRAWRTVRPPGHY